MSDMFTEQELSEICRLQSRAVQQIGLGLNWIGILNSASFVTSLKPRVIDAMKYLSEAQGNLVAIEAIMLKREGEKNGDN